MPTPLNKYRFRKELEEITKRKSTRYLTKILVFPYALIRHFFCLKKIVIPNMDFHILNQCSLNCENCSNMIPYFQKREQFPLDELQKDFACLTMCVDEILECHVLGGEPFLHKDLGKFLQDLIDEKKLKKIVVVTNGTILPSETLIPVLKHKKVLVRFSNYYPISKEMNRLIPLFMKNGISWDIANIPCWNEMKLYCGRKLDSVSREKIFARCARFCLTFLHGEFHLCPISAQGKMLGILQVSEEDFIDIRQAADPNIRKKIRKAFFALFSRKEISACSICDGMYTGSPIVEMAKQLPSGTILSLETKELQ